MANLLNKDPFTYHQEYTTFLRELRGYHINRGTPFIKLPQIAGRDVDLYLLYRRVIALGGWQKVNDEQNWEEFLEEFNVPKGCTNGIQALKQIYIRFLNEYEKVNFLGEDPDHEIMDDDDDGPSRKKSSTPLHNVALTYKYSQHKVSENNRQHAGLSCQFVTFSDYEKLEMALLSGLPNEVDFVVNVCTLLSNDGKKSLRLDKSKHLLDLLLAHIGIFTNGEYSLEGIYESGWRPLSNRNFVKFWYDTVHDKEVREMISDTRDASRLRQWVGEEVLNLGRDLGVNDVEGQRVTQMAIIVRNLSFDDENMQVLASNRNVFRFLLLCIYSKYGSLRQIGLDTLGNSAVQMVLQSVDHPDTQLILRLVSKCLSSSDKCEVVRGLEILSKLCQVPENESLLSEHLESKAYEDICKLLTVHDIQLIIYTLEALYQLSELGESTANAIASVKHSVDILVQLVTVEAQSYGPNSLIGIKVVEFVPHQSSGGATIGPPVPPQPPPPLVMSTKLIPASGAPPSPEIETTCNWLRANIELKDGNYMSHLSLYTDYLSFCKKFSLPNPLNSSVLHTCVKAVFPNVDEKIIERKDGNKDIQFSGFSKRQTPLPFAITWQVDKAPSIHPSHGFQRTSNSSQSCLTHTPTLRQRLLEPPLVHLQPDSCPPFPAGSSSTHSNQLPGVQHATMTNPVTPPTPKSHHVQSSQQKHCAKLLQSPGTPLRTNLASPSAPSTPVSRPLVVSTLPSLVSGSSPAGKTVSVLQQQLRSPIAQQSSKLQDSALTPQQSAASPNQHYPCIQHALHNEQDQNANQGAFRQQSRPIMQAKNVNLSFQDNNSVTSVRSTSETNLIKSLLAKKLNQNRGVQNPLIGQQYHCHESLGSSATTIVCNAPPSPARSDAAVSQDAFPLLETKPCTKTPLQIGGVSWTQHSQPIDSPAQSDTMESQTSVSLDSHYTDDQSLMETKATEVQVTSKDQIGPEGVEIKCESSFQVESMEVDSSLSNSQAKPLAAQLTLQEGLKTQMSAGDVESTTQHANGSLLMPSNSVPVSASLHNSHLEDELAMKNTPNLQQSHLLPNPDSSKSLSVSSESIVIQAVQPLEHPLVMQPASKLTNPQQKSAELVIQVGSEPSLQHEVVIQPAADRLNNEDLVIQAQLQDQQDMLQSISTNQQGEPFVIQGSQILMQQHPQQQPTPQQLLIQVPAQAAQPAQQLVIQTTPPAQQTQQLVIQVPPQQQQFVIQAQQPSSALPQTQQQYQQQIVIHDLLEDASQGITPENQQFEGLPQSNFSQQSPVQFGQDQIQLLGQSPLPAANANTLYSQPHQPVDGSNSSGLQQNQVVIQYQPVSQSAMPGSLPTLPKVSPASPGEASLDSSLSPQTLTKCVFQSQGPLFPSSQNIQLENSQKNKKGRTSPVNKNTMAHTCRTIVKSTVPKQKLTQNSDSTIPHTLSPCSPRALEIEVCGEVECAKDIVKEGAEARIERVENKCLRLLDRPVEPSNVENTESSQAAGVVGNAKELPDSVTKNNLLPCADHKKLLHNHTHSIPELKDKMAEPPVTFVYSTDPVPKRNVEFVGSNICHNIHDSSTCHLHRPLSSSKIKEETGAATADSIIKTECPNSNMVQMKKEEQTTLTYDHRAENENLGVKQMVSTKCESPKPNRTVYAPVAQINGAASAVSQCPHGRALDESSKLCISEQPIHNGLATSSLTETKLNLNEIQKSEEPLSVNEKTVLHKPVDRLGKVNGIINHLGSNECKPSIDAKPVVLAENQKERKRKASVSSLSPNSYSSSSSSSSSLSSLNSSSIVARVPENGCVVNGLLQENVIINDCKFLTDNNDIERTATNLNSSGSCAKKHRQSEVTGNNITLKKKSEKSNTSVVCSYVNRTCESRLVPPPPDFGDGDISCDSSSVSSVQDAFDKQHSNLNQGLPGTLLGKDNKDTALHPGQSISPKGGTILGNLDKSAKSRKRIRNSNGSMDSRCSSAAGSEFVCEWANCKRCFESSKSVYSHVYSAHVVTESDGVCKWEGCEKLERKKWSLVTHIQDHHCSDAALRASSQRRIQSAQMTLSGAVAHAAPPAQSQPLPPPPPPLQVSPAAAASVSTPCVATPGSGASGVVGTGVAAAAAAAAALPPGTANLVYPPDAAIQAIRRFSARPPFPELMPTNQVPYPVHYQRFDFKPRNPECIFMEMQLNNNPVFQTYPTAFSMMGESLTSSRNISLSTLSLCYAHKNKKHKEPREGPVTKHIRLTAALILRNLSRYSTLGRGLLKKHETYLGYTAMSAVESSNALANCLWEILQNH